MDIIFSFFIILVVVVAYWAFLVFPRQRDYKKHIQYVQTLQIGDEVITFGGLIGTITHIDEDYGFARLQVADGVEVRVMIFAIRQVYNPEEIAHNIRMAQGQSEVNEI